MSKRREESPVPMLRFSQNHTAFVTAIVLHARKTGKVVFFEIKANICLFIQQWARLYLADHPLLEFV